MAANLLEMKWFMDQFSYLVNNGFNAHLSFNCKDGRVFVNLQSSLDTFMGAGVAEPPTDNSNSELPKKPKPARLRRRKRRSEQKKAATNDKVDVDPGSSKPAVSASTIQPSLDSSAYTKDLMDNSERSSASSGSSGDEMEPVFEQSYEGHQSSLRDENCDLVYGMIGQSMDEAGLKKEVIFNHVQTRMSIDELDNVIDFLSSEGHIYSTTDDDRYKITDDD